ncbi:hypothetical protein HGM15179_006508 [Zosterops borbonicus]|uniref:Uncharacterized protein n=1 Tax=Zosterops borbonicus TaxID=364589 RepID=A0A8K1LP00_9PASS|nr:hypothetical protein HGM15179_006508 [Zosterops borbonicus]
MPDHPFCEEILPDAQHEPPLEKPEDMSSHPVACCLGEEAKPHLATATFQGVLESGKTFLEPSFHQAKQTQLPQLLLVGITLETLHQLCNEE